MWRSQRPKRASVVVATLAVVAVTLSAQAESKRGKPARQIVEPSDALRDEYGLEPFHAKWLDAGGIPVLASERVHDAALLEAAHVIERMLAARPDVHQAMAEGPTRFVIMAPDEMTTDVPEHADLLPARYWDKRARGLGATTVRPAVSSGEENVLDLDGDPYATESILVHEFSHAVHEMGVARVDPTFDTRLEKVYRAAMSEGLWKDTYAATNRMEYWAEGAQSWFDTNRQNDALHGHVDTRAEVREYDPRLAALLEEVFGDSEWRYVKPRRRTDPGHLAGFDRTSAPAFVWPEAVKEAYEQDTRDKQAWQRRDDEPYVDWLLRRAESGDPGAQCELGWRHREGNEVERDDAQAVAWFRRAAELGDPRGQDHLGWMHLVGRGVERDEEAARRFFVQAASRRFAQAQFNLGRMELSAAEAEPENLVQAYMWFALASRRRHSGALAELKTLDAQLSAEQLAKARHLAREWQPD
jgi:hypothetical protein